MNKVQSLFHSRRFWVAIAGVVTVALQGTLGISPETVEPILAIAIAWIVGDSLNKTGA